MFDYITSLHPILFNTIALLLSLVIVIKAADLLIFGISNYARKFGISDYLIGFLVLAIGTSLPELVSSLMGGSAGSSGVAIGTILGSGVITITFVLGTMTVFAKKLDVKTKLLGKSKYMMLGMIILPLILASDGLLSRADGIVLIAVFFMYIAGLWRKEGTLGKLKKNVKLKYLWKDMFVFLGALAALLIGARFLVFSSVIISQELGISAYLIALIVIGLGASLPDLTVELKSLKKGHAAIGFGNVLGGITAEMLLVLGIVALAYPINIGGIGLMGLVTTIVFFVFGMALVLFWVRKEQLLRWQGYTLIAIYFIFVAIQLLIEFLG
jgi:cation:H+ antiporter